MSKFATINFQQWIDDHRELLKPPVGNKVVWKDREFIIMVVGGPNTRKDFHFNAGEEFFYQIEGDINLKVMDEGKEVNIPIKEGEIYLLPARVPHSPQRPANTIGLVVERKRSEGELDGFLWYCEDCGYKLHQEYFKLTDIVSQLPPIFEKYYSDENLRTCSECDKVMEAPVKS